MRNFNNINENNPAAHLHSRPFLRKSLSKNHTQATTRRSGLKQIVINLRVDNTATKSPIPRDLSKQILQKCKIELEQQKIQLLKKLQQKQEKVQKLRDTYRQIQRSRSKDEKIRPKIILKPKNVLLSTPSHRTQSPVIKLHANQGMSTARNSSILHNSLQRTSLFPSSVLPCDS